LRRGHPEANRDGKPAYRSEKDVPEKGRLMMDEKTMRLDTECEDAEVHTEHLCYLVAQGFDVADEPYYRALVEHPKFQCSHCGRKAGSSRNLCVPVRA
jgi:hypothetical protein